MSFDMQTLLFSFDVKTSYHQLFLWDEEKGKMNEYHIYTYSVYVFQSFFLFIESNLQAL